MFSKVSMLLLVAIMATGCKSYKLAGSAQIIWTGMPYDEPARASLKLDQQGKIAMTVKAGKNGTWKYKSITPGDIKPLGESYIYAQFSGRHMVNWRTLLISADVMMKSTVTCVLPTGSKRLHEGNADFTVPIIWGEPLINGCVIGSTALNDNLAGVRGAQALLTLE